MKRPLVAVVAFDRISPFHLSVPCVVFGEPPPGVPEFDLKVCAVTPGELSTTAGFSIRIAHDLRVLRRARMVIVPSWRDPAERPPQALLDALVAAHRRGVQIVGLCLGAFVLAEAGLLDGRQATTHWEVAQEFQRRYPRVQVQANQLYVSDGTVVTSAGTAAGIDCCLQLLREQHGAGVANTMARRLVVPPHRRGGQAQYIEQPVPERASDSRLTELIEWTRANLQLPHTLDSLSARALMSRRTFTRRFRRITGGTVGGWLLGERLALSQRLLETTADSIERVAARAGFGSAASLRQHFRAAFKASPTTWRQMFSGAEPRRVGASDPVAPARPQSLRSERRTLQRSGVVPPPAQ